MPEKTKTIVIIESHEQTIIRRSRRVTTSHLVSLTPVRRSGKGLAWLANWWKTRMPKGKAGGIVLSSPGELTRLCASVAASVITRTIRHRDRGVEVTSTKSTERQRSLTEGD